MESEADGRNGEKSPRPEKFLQAVAAWYTQPGYIGELYRTCLVCPNKRSRIFLRMYLRENLRRMYCGTDSATTVIMPEFITIGELNEHIVPDTIPADDIDLLFRLYRIYCRVYTKRFANVESVFNKARQQEDEERKRYEKLRAVYKEVLKSGDKDRIGKALKELRAQNAIYKKARKQTATIPSRTPVPFDNFAFWGRNMLNDFNDIDNGCADGEALLEKVAEWKGLSVNYLTEKERRIVNDLFPRNNLPPESSDVMFRNMDSFTVAVRKLRLYALLPEIYREFTAELDREGIVYGGRLARRVAETAAVAVRDSGMVPFLDRFSHVGFVGFGNLTAAQMNLIDIVRKGLSLRGDQVEFFWDRLDTGRLGDSLAFNDYVERFARDFPNPEGFSLPEDEGPLNLDVVACPSKFMMGKAIGMVLDRWSAEHDDGKYDTFARADNRPDNTAIILPDPTLLVPVLHAIPRSVMEDSGFKDINVSLALPFRDTPFASLLDAIVGLHLHASYKKDSETRETDAQIFREDVETLISNPQLRTLMPDGCTAVAEFLKNDRSFNLSLKYLTDCLAEKALEHPRVSAIMPFFVTTPRMPAVTQENGKPTAEFNDYLKAVRRYMGGITGSLRACLLEQLDRRRKLDGSPRQLQLFVESRVDDKEDEEPCIELDILDAYDKGMRHVFDCVMRYNVTGIGERTILTMVYRVMATQPINMSGTPVRGLQILEMLETRGLDFDNLIIPSVNEGILPSRSHQRSFISQGARYKFNDIPVKGKDGDNGEKPLLPIVHLATVRDTEMEYAGYFFRLLNRAANVVCLYDSRTDIPGGGTPSRYLQQLKNSDKSWSCNAETERLRPTADKVEIARHALAKARKEGATDAQIERDTGTLGNARELHGRMENIERRLRDATDTAGHLLHPMRISDITMQMEPKSPRPRIFRIEKDSFVLDRLSRFTVPVEKEEALLSPKGLRSSNLSASALRNYIRCPFLFYLRYVLNISEDSEPLDFMDASEFGTVVHDSLQEIFEKKIGSGQSVEKLNGLFEPEKWKLTEFAKAEIAGIVRDKVLQVHYHVFPPRDSQAGTPEWQKAKERWERMHASIRRQDRVVIDGMTDYIEKSLKKDFSETAEGSRKYVSYLKRTGSPDWKVKKYEKLANRAQLRTIVFEGAEVDYNPTRRPEKSHGIKVTQWPYDDCGNMVNLTLKIDRIDRFIHDGNAPEELEHLRFIDYKTGGDSKVSDSIESMLPARVLKKFGVDVPANLDTHGTSFQLLLYAMLYADLVPDPARRRIIETHLYTLLKAYANDPKNVFEDSSLVIKSPSSKDPTAVKDADRTLVWATGDPSVATDVYDESKRDSRLADMEQRFRRYVRELIREILDPEIPFAQTDDIDNCQYCDFAELCQRYKLSKEDDGDEAATPDK